MMERFALWLLRKFSPEKSSLFMGGDPVERATRWEQFYREEGGLADMIAALRKEAFEAAQEAGAKDDQTRLAWMLQDRAYRALDNRICGVIATGKALQKQIEETERLRAPWVSKSI
jgi:hypothetical protein